MNTIKIEDDTTEPVAHLIRNRLPWLIFGLIGGLATSVVVSRFEKALEGDIRLAFFIPIIVYMSDAVGTQTETICVRHLGRKAENFWKYFRKEVLLGLWLGILLGGALGIFAYFWLGSLKIALTTGLAMFINVVIAPVVAVIFPFLLKKEHVDPALGSGPLATVAQDFLSLVIYFSIALLIIF